MKIRLEKVSSNFFSHLKPELKDIIHRIYELKRKKIQRHPAKTRKRLLQKYRSLSF